MFQCDNTTCVSIIQVCNGHKDCANGADETLCASRQCAPFQFRCANKRCVFLSQVCDGKNDCADNSDELHCKPTTCSRDQHTCPNGRCISRQWLCDGGNDCGDESDESPSVCHSQTCDPGTRFQCNASRKCIPKRWTCDGDGDTPPPFLSLCLFHLLATPSLPIIRAKLLQPSLWLYTLTPLFPLELTLLRCSLSFVQRLLDTQEPSCSHQT